MRECKDKLTPTRRCGEWKTNGGWEGGADKVSQQKRKGFHFGNLFPQPAAMFGSSLLASRTFALWLDTPKTEFPINAYVNDIDMTLDEALPPVSSLNFRSKTTSQAFRLEYKYDHMFVRHLLLCPFFLFLSSFIFDLDKFSPLVTFLTSVSVGFAVEIRYLQRVHFFHFLAKSQYNL